MTEHNSTLIDIRARFCSARFELYCDESIQLMLDWIKDLKDNDPIAMWCWTIVDRIYHTEV